MYAIASLAEENSRTSVFGRHYCRARFGHGGAGREPRNIGNRRSVPTHDCHWTKQHRDWKPT